MTKNRKLIVFAIVATFLLMATCAFAAEGTIKETKNSDGKAFSALCPAGWNDFSAEHTPKGMLLFAQGDNAALYFSKPYFVVEYQASFKLNLNNIKGEDVTYDIGGQIWNGKYDAQYNTIYLVTILKAGGSFGVNVGKVDKDGDLIKDFLASIKAK